MHAEEETKKKGKVVKPAGGKRYNKFNLKETNEEGFTGPPSSWFDDEAFKKGLVADFAKKEGADYYFESYSNFYIHEEMLKDKVRTESYRSAIENNPEAFKDKVVLDIGCGTGVLSIFAARAGAKHVYGIDNADIVHYAREIVKQNGFEKQITIIQGKVEEIDLPVEKVDIIISEWMGYFLLYESMLDTVLFARDKWLQSGGIILPDKCTMHVAAIEDKDYKTKKLNFWNNVYGIDMSCLTPASFVEPVVDSMSYDPINTTEDTFFEIDLYTVKTEDLEFSNTYNIQMMRDDTIHGIVTWFDIFFGNMKHEVKFSTGPYEQVTHWKQTVFYFNGEYKLKEGDIISGSIACKKSSENFRACDIKISYHIRPQSNKFEDIDCQVLQYKLR
uniref:type I protein arginine methyltransferase n=1 Tax=Euplotes crassus TaxID=5936 RepID=A0A7S3KFV0_EUPCR